MDKTTVLEQFSDNTEMIYKAGLNPDFWPYALEALSKAFKASKAQLLYINSDNLTFSFASGYGFDPYKYDIGASKFRRYLLQDPITVYALDKPNDPFSDHLVIPEIEKDQSPMQRDIRDPAGMRYLLTTYLTDDEGDGVALIFFRDKNEGPFLEEEVDLFRLYQPHIRQSTSIHKAFTHNSQMSSLHSAALNALNYGIIVLDENRRIVVCNQYAKALVDKNTSFSIRSGKIASMKRNIQCNINAIINSALDGNERGNLDRRYATKIETNKKDGDFIVVASALMNQKFNECMDHLPMDKPHYTSRFPNRRYVMLTLCALGHSNKGLIEMLIEFFGLTPAEASLANKLVGECSLKNAATQLGRSVGTARVQLHSIFQKTDTNSQTGLIKLLMALQ